MATETAQERLAEIWKQVLDIDHDLNENSDFFDLGGDSLLAMRVVSRTRRTFGIELSVRRLLRAPTLGAFASVVALSPRSAE